MADLAEQIQKVDRFYAAELKKLDDFYGIQVDKLVEKIQTLQAELNNLTMRVASLERKQ